MGAENINDVLFEIKKQHLETGLRGFPVGYCTTSKVDPEKGLYYMERPVSELIQHEPIEVIYLLYHGKAPSQEEAKQFALDLQKRATCSPKLLDLIRSLPREGHPMKLFSTALLLAGMLKEKNDIKGADYREDCLNIIAQVPEIAATVINHHAGWKNHSSPKSSLEYIENFTSLLNVPNVDKAKLCKVLKLFNILHYDHGGGNLSTFVGKAVASSREDMYGSLAAAMCALEGPLHGKANEDALVFVKKALKDLGENATVNELEGWLKKQIAEGAILFGFGHAVLRVEDSRAAILYGEAKSDFSNSPEVKMALLLREVGPKVLKENPKISNPYPNVDAISGSLLTAAGFPYPEYFTVLFGVSRVVGIAIQIVYERCVARGGKGLPIVRPKYIYKSPIEQKI